MSTDRRDGLTGGLGIKAPCRVATTANVTLSGLQTFNDVTLADSDRVLVWFQTTASENGIYVASSGNWQRATDFDGANDVADGTLVYVNEGTAYAGQMFAVATSDPVTIGSSSIVFEAVDNIVGTSGISTLASATTVDLGGVTVEELNLSGTSTVTSFGSSAPTGAIRRVAYTGRVPLTYNATSMKLVGKRSRTNNVDDISTFRHEGSGNWRELSYVKASGDPVKVNAGYISGLTLSNNVVDAVNDIDVSIGTCADVTNAEQIILTSAITKRLDAPWSAGTNQGGLDTGSIANTTYHVFAIMRPDTGVVDVIFSTSPTSPTMPSGYTYKRRLGSILRVGGAILAFTQYGNEFLLGAEVDGISATINSGANLQQLVNAVPNGIVVKAIFQITFANNTVPAGMKLYNPGTSPLGASYFIRSQVSDLGNAAGRCAVWTNTSAQIGMYISVDSSTVIISVSGWIDPI